MMTPSHYVDLRRDHSGAGGAGDMAFAFARTMDRVHHVNESAGDPILAVAFPEMRQGTRKVVNGAVETVKMPWLGNVMRVFGSQEALSTFLADHLVTGTIRIAGMTKPAISVVPATTTGTAYFRSRTDDRITNSGILRRARRLSARAEKRGADEAEVERMIGSAVLAMMRGREAKTKSDPFIPRMSTSTGQQMMLNLRSHDGTIGRADQGQLSSFGLSLAGPPEMDPTSKVDPVYLPAF